MRIRLRVATCCELLGATSVTWVRTYPTPPRPTSAVLEPGTTHFLSICLSIVPGSMKSWSRPKGMTADGTGGVSGRSTGQAVVSAERLKALATYLEGDGTQR